MENFAIAINIESDYNKVKEYAEKWGYKPYDDRGYDEKRIFVWFEDNIFNPCHGVGRPSVKNWRKAIRKNSPLTLENVYVRIDTVERVKEVWEIIKDCGVGINSITSFRMMNNCLDKSQSFLHFNRNEFSRTGYSHKGKTEISPKQLAQLLRVNKKNGHQFDGNSIKAVIDKPKHKLSIPKIAICVKNKQEFDELMSIYEVLGWKWQCDFPITKNEFIRNYTPTNISFNNSFAHSCTKEDYTIIPFSQIKGLK